MIFADSNGRFADVMAEALAAGVRYGRTWIIR
jgi:hypothetical protein